MAVGLMRRFLRGKNLRRLLPLNAPTFRPHLKILLSIFLCGCVSNKAKSEKTLFPHLQEVIWQQLDMPIPKKIVEPYAVSKKDVARAFAVAYVPSSARSSALALKDALFSKGEFGLKYAPLVTAVATETLKRGAGNCLSLASVYVGLARGIGLHAHYLDASGFVQDVYQGEQVMVRSGHVTAVVETESGKVALDLGHRLRKFQIFRLMSDQEAIAHFYNNRGYELIYEAQAKGEAGDWHKAAASFALATHVMPEFVNAWNNLGVAMVRLGRVKLAALCYRRALQLNPHSPSPHMNLGLLYLGQQKLALALTYLAHAVDLDPQSAHLHYYLGLAHYRAQNRIASKKALQKALELNPSLKDARSLLDKIKGSD